MAGRAAIHLFGNTPAIEYCPPAYSHDSTTPFRAAVLGTLRLPIYGRERLTIESSFSTRRRFMSALKNARRHRDRLDAYGLTPVQVAHFDVRLIHAVMLSAVAYHSIMRPVLDGCEAPPAGSGWRSGPIYLWALSSNLFAPVVFANRDWLLSSPENLESIFSGNLRQITRRLARKRSWTELSPGEWLEQADALVARMDLEVIYGPAAYRSLLADVERAAREV